MRLPEDLTCITIVSGIRRLHHEPQYIMGGRSSIGPDRRLAVEMRRTDRNRRLALARSRTTSFRFRRPYETSG